MNARTRLVRTFSFDGGCLPPRYESEFSEEVIRAWRGQGRLGQRSPEGFFALDPRHALDVAWRRLDAERSPLESHAGLEAIRLAYDPAMPGRFPVDLPLQVKRLQQRGCAVYGSPWNEGFLQVIGISDGASLCRALIALCEQPKLAEAAMEHYAWFIETLLDRILSGVQLDYAVFYEPIASNHAPVLSPETYSHHVVPALRRVAECLERHGTAFRFIWTAGHVQPLIPLWLDAGINGFHINHGPASGIYYTGLRRAFGKHLLIFGGVDWRAVLEGPDAMDAFLRTEVRPLLEQGGYIPHLNDTVRAYLPFEGYSYYRQQLDTLTAQVFG